MAHQHTKKPPKARPGSRFLWRPEAALPFVAVGFFVLFFLYLWRRVEPALEYQHSTPAFLTSSFFFHGFLGRPGGLAEYLAAFLAQLNCISWLGALVYTGFAGLSFLAIRGLLQRISGSPSLMAPFVSAFILLLLRNGGECPSLAPGIGWLASLALALAYVRLPWSRAGLRAAACWSFAALLLYAAGYWPCLHFAPLAGLFEMARRGRWFLGWGCALSGLGALLVALGWPGADLSLALNGWGSGAARNLWIALYLLVPLSLATAFVKHPARPLIWWRNATKHGLAAGLLLPGWAAVWLLFDAPRQSMAQMDYHASRKEYEQVLLAAAKLKALNAASEIRLHRALYHQGRLLRDLFSYANQTAWELLPSLSRGLDACRPQSETLFELGQVNVAEHLAHEALECEGDRPELLRLLALINILKDRPKAARVFLNALSQIPFQHARAQDISRRLAADARLLDDPELARVRSLKVAADLPHSKVSAEDLMLQLLQGQPLNQMAFEYLMAHYLLTRQLDKLVSELGRLDDFNYDGFPRHVEEAILLFQELNKSKVELRGRAIRAETLQRFERFFEALKRREPESPEGRERLTRDFGDTYWYYYFLRSAANRPAAAVTNESS